MSSGREFSWGIVAPCWNCPDSKKQESGVFAAGKSSVIYLIPFIRFCIDFFGDAYKYCSLFIYFKRKKVVCGTATERLWTSHDGSQSMQGIQLNSLVKLCLGDPSFPAFVEEVEKELDKIIKEQGKTPDSHQD